MTMVKLKDGFELRMEKRGWGGPQNVLFIHGNLASCEWWRPTMGALCDLGGSGSDDSAGQLVCADWRGYGRSLGLKTESEIDFGRFAQDYIELIELQGLRNVHVVGHSTGGLIAMMAILLRPDLFKSLVLLDSVGAKGLELQLPLEQVLAHFKNMSENKEYFRQVLATTIRDMKADSSEFLEIVDVTWSCDKVCWEGVPRILSTCVDIEDRMSEIQLPTLVLHGADDLVLPAAGSEKLARQILRAELRILKDTGHSYNMESPIAFARDLRSFWSSSLS